MSLRNGSGGPGMRCSRPFVPAWASSNPRGWSLSGPGRRMTNTGSAKMLDGGAAFAQSHAAGPDDPVFRVRTWRKANPSLPAMPALEARIRGEAVSARRDSALLPIVPGASSQPWDGRCWGRDPARGRDVEGERGGCGAGRPAGMGGGPWDVRINESACAAYWPGYGPARIARELPPGARAFRSEGTRMAWRGCIGAWRNARSFVVTGGAAVDIGEFLEPRP